MKLAGPGALATSALLHGAALVVGAWILSRSLAASAASFAAPQSVEVTLTGSEIELPRMAEPGGVAQPDRRARPEPDRELPGGGEIEPRPDVDREGRGGDDTARERALNLASSVDGFTRDRELPDRLDRSQVQRLDTDSRRRSLDNRRATPNPMLLTFVATGHGRTAQRRPDTPSDPGNGVLDATTPASLGGELGGPALPDDGAGAALPEGADRRGAEAARPGAGLAESERRNDFRRSASVTLARPWVQQARAAVPAACRGRPSDTRSSAADVASVMQSLVHASSAGGVHGAGNGGARGAPSPGSGGTAGPGSRSPTAGYGPGRERDVAVDPRFTSWFRDVERRVEPLWRDAFPEWAITEGRGGLAIIAFTVRRDGSVSDVRVVRPSGIPEFDRNVAAAVRHASPLPPLPSMLGPRIRLEMTFDAVNPAVGREGGGPGGHG